MIFYCQTTFAYTKFENSVSTFTSENNYKRVYEGAHAPYT